MRPSLSVFLFRVIYLGSLMCEPAVNKTYVSCAQKEKPTRARFESAIARSCP
jgi:hypothetical protein